MGWNNGTELINVELLLVSKSKTVHTTAEPNEKEMHFGPITVGEVCVAVMHS